MKEDLQILKEVFTWKNIGLGILFNVLGIGWMYGLLYFFLYLRHDMGWI